MTALFGEDVLRNKRNTEAVEIAPGRVVVARALEHKPTTLRPLDEVRAGIAQRLTDEEALRLARAAGMERLKQLQAGESTPTTWGLARSVSRENPAGIDPRAIPPVFRVDPAKVPAYVGVDLPPTGYGLYRVSKVTEAKAVDEARVARDRRRARAPGGARRLSGVRGRPAQPREDRDQRGEPEEERTIGFAGAQSASATIPPATTLKPQST